MIPCLESHLLRLTNVMTDLRQQVRAILANELSQAIGLAVRDWLQRWIVSTRLPARALTDTGDDDTGQHTASGWSSFEPFGDQVDSPLSTATSWCDAEESKPLDRDGDRQTWWHGLAGTLLIGLFSYVGGPWMRAFCHIAHTINHLTHA